MVNLTGIQQKTVFLTTYHSFIFHPLLVAEQLTHYSFCSVVAHSHSGGLVGWVGGCCPLFRWVAGGARQTWQSLCCRAVHYFGGSQPKLRSGGATRQWLAFFSLAQKVSGKAPSPWALTQPPKDLGNFYFYF